jgi:hypothetical protein
VFKLARLNFYAHRIQLVVYDKDILIDKEKGQADKNESEKSDKKYNPYQNINPLFDASFTGMLI